jgi:hypothetical protein
MEIILSQRGKPKGEGVALCSTFGRLQASVAWHEMYVCPVRYRLYHEGSAFNDELDALLHKRQGFECEREVRILKVDEPHYSALTAGLSPFILPAPALSDPPKPLDLHIPVSWSLRECVDAITVSPYAGEAYEIEVRQQIERLDPALAKRVELSVLSERRYKPNF